MLNKQKNNSGKIYILIGLIVLIGLMVVTSVIMQVTIDISYLIGQYYPIIFTNFNANDLLSYWGNYLSALIGSFVAIIGVYITIHYNQRQTKQMIVNGNRTTEKIIENNRADIIETNRKSILPIIVINRLITRYVGLVINIPSDLDNKKEISNTERAGYQESDIDEFIFVIEKGSISVQHELTEEQKKKVQSEFKTVREGNRLTFMKPDYEYISFKFTNAGLGPAINMTFSLIKDGLIESEDFHVTTLAFSVKQNLEMRLGFFIHEPKYCMGEYVLSIKYYDIHNVKYNQKHNLTVGVDNSIFDLSIVQTFKRVC